MDCHAGADITAVASAAVMLALPEHTSKYKDPQEPEKHAKSLKVQMKHFQEAMVKIRPLSAHELNKYKRVSLAKQSRMQDNAQPSQLAQ